MKIGFDGKRATQNFTGLGNYSRYVLKILAQYYPENHYSVYALNAPEKSMHLNKVTSVRFHYPDNQISKSYWRSYSIVNDLHKEQIELYHGLSNEIPFGLKKAGILSVVTIHDLIFIRYPQYYSFFDRKMYEYKVRYACDHADKIIAISEQTKRDLISYFKVEEKRIEVIYQNCDPIFRLLIPEEEKIRIRSLYRLPEKYILNVGTIEIRKNLLLTVKALKELDKNIHLVVIGKATSYAQKVRKFINENGLINRVHFLENVPFHDLPGIYQQSLLFVYPSEFEGFGIPIIEALSSGIPVIAAQGSCLEEAGGTASIYVNSKDVTGLASQIEYVLENMEKRQEMILGGFEHLKQFSDDKIADKIFNLYKNLLINA